MRLRKRSLACLSASLLALGAFASPAAAQAPATAPVPVPASPAPAPAASSPEQPATDQDATLPTAASRTASETDILGLDTFSMLLDGRAVGADGHASFLERGLGKTRFSGDPQGDFTGRVVPVEADLIWQPRFTRTVSANVSGTWQRGQENPFDLLEAFVTFLPSRGRRTSFSLKGGLYWPEISLEHATGGAWSTVNTITPSAINSWVGEEVKLVGLEGTVAQQLGRHELWLTGGVFGFNDTSGTLLSFRGWALHDFKATAFGQIPLPPLNSFITLLQAHETRSTIELDNRPGFYGRLEWRPPWPVTVNVFYYDNRGDPHAFVPSGQWGWRTRFLNVGINADLGGRTRLLAQGMAGTTKMGFDTNDRIWVNTRFRSAYLLLTHEIGRGAITGRIEAFDTLERGSQMSPLESENGWAATLAGRLTLERHLTGFLELLHIESDRGTRAGLGIPPREDQTVVQASLRFHL